MGVAAWRKTIAQTVIDDIDIWRAANALIDRYGEDASMEAVMRADEMLEQGYSKP